MSRILAPSPRARVEPLPVPPTFSIVVPAYQAADTIARSVRSALAQTHRPHEIVVVDDGSTDDLAAVLAQFTGLLTVVRKPNGGGASALNEGLEAASGDFMAILDADDAYHPRRLEALAGLARFRPDLDLVTSDARLMVGDDVVGSFRAYNPFDVEDQRTAILRSCFVGGWPAVRSSGLRAIEGFDESLRTGYDWDCWLRLILDGARAGLVDEAYYDYHRSSGSLTANRVSSLWDRVRLLEKAEGNAALRPEERPTLLRSLRHHRSRAVRAELQATDGSRSRRGELLRFAASRRFERRARIEMGLAAIAPALARRLASSDPP
jgi:glycosyltransferase involved in cell wall biosynthesis